LLTQTLQHIRDGLLSLAYPQECRICQKSVDSWNDGVVCARCWRDTSVTKLFANAECCFKCNAPLLARNNFPALLQGASEFEQSAGSQPLSLAQTERADGASDLANIGVARKRWCNQCDDLPFTFARSCGAYSGALEANVLFLKSQPHICRKLRDILLRTFAVNQEILASQVLIPVPLHPARQLERGFNQAELLAKLLASHFHLPLGKNLLIRNKNTDRHRAGMDELDRLKSVERAFQASNANAIENVSVLLIDDLFTTGSTLSCAAKTLLHAGAAQVKVFTIAKVLGRIAS
jgi:ComF family protein